MRVVVAGGGLAGLIAATRLARHGFTVELFEKRSYPAHKVCGEYVSNETLPFLQREGLYPTDAELPMISRFQLSSVSGKSSIAPLPLGGFGVSRYYFDHYLFQRSLEAGVRVYPLEEVLSIRFRGGRFLIMTARREVEADYVIGAYGKRSRLEKKVPRSPFIGVKYHIRTDHPADLITLHNFPGGYCGVSKVEGNTWNLCYLSTRENLRRVQTIPELESKVLARNPLLRDIFKNSQFLWSKPETINEVSFAIKSPVTDHILMAGDAAGMIAPLAGNGMAMAIRSARLLSDLLIQGGDLNDRDKMERQYQKEWNHAFSWHLWRGRQLQRLFGNPAASELAVRIMRSPFLATRVIKLTHGNPF